MTGIPFTTGSREADAAFTAAAARFFDLLRTFAAEPLGARAQPPDWTSFGSLLAGQFEQWLKGAPAAGASFAAAAGFPGAATAWPGAVPLGPAAAQGADAQTAWELVMKLGQLQGELARHWSEIAQSSAQRFVERMRAKGGADLSSEGALALYETWVECAEEAYGATVRKDDFCRLQAQLTNTAMALLLAQRKQAEVLARAWGLPTREEADALQRQIRELRQELERRTTEREARNAANPEAAAPRPKTRSRPKHGAHAGKRRRRGSSDRGRR